MSNDAPWLRVETEGIFAPWHMPVGGGAGFVLTACDRRLFEDVNEREVDEIGADERCPICQGVYEAREA